MPFRSTVKPDLLYFPGMLVCRGAKLLYFSRDLGPKLLCVSRIWVLTVPELLYFAGVLGPHAARTTIL